MHLDYPGPSSTHAGNIGAESYVAGRSFGVRITHIPGHKFRLEHLVDALPEGRHVDLSEQDLPDGSFGFEFCCNRSFQVDDVVIEASSPGADDTQNDTADHTRLTVPYDGRDTSLTDAEVTHARVVDDMLA